MSKKKQPEKTDSTQIDVYDYCDKMMQDLGHYEKKIDIPSENG